MSDQRRVVVAATGFALAAIFVVGFWFTGSVAPEFSSVEIAFAELSPGGLAIVPASCPSVPSNPDFPHNTCSCPAPQILVENTCVCPNGLSTTLYPSCACPQGSAQTGPGSTICVPPPDNCPLPREMINGSCQCRTGTWDGSQCTSLCPGGQVWNGTNCSCPAGMTWNGTMCVPTTCPSGQFWDGTACVCPSGTHWNGTQCVSVFCPTGYTWNGSQCVAQCTLHNYCAGPDRNGDGVGDNVWTQNAQCQDSFTRECTWGCYNGQCLSAPQGLLEIGAVPRLVRRGDTTNISWDAQNVSSCTIDENNLGITDSWSGAMMGCSNNTCSGSHRSSEITQQTRYTLSCVGLDGNSYTSTVVVNILPVFIEI